MCGVAVRCPAIRSTLEIRKRAVPVRLAARFAGRRRLTRFGILDDRRLVRAIVVPAPVLVLAVRIQLGESALVRLLGRFRVLLIWHTSLIPTIAGAVTYRIYVLRFAFRTMSVSLVLT